MRNWTKCSVSSKVVSSVSKYSCVASLVKSSMMSLTGYHKDKEAKWPSIVERLFSKVVVKFPIFNHLAIVFGTSHLFIRLLPKRELSVEFFWWCQYTGYLQRVHRDWCHLENSFSKIFRETSDPCLVAQSPQQSVGENDVILA